MCEVLKRERERIEQRPRPTMTPSQDSFLLPSTHTKDELMIVD